MLRCDSKLTVCLEFAGRTAATAGLVHGLHDEDVFGSALQAVNGVMVLFDVGHDHPAVHRVTKTCSTTNKHLQYKHGGGYF